MFLLANKAQLRKSLMIDHSTYSKLRLKNTFQISLLILCISILGYIVVFQDDFQQYRIWMSFLFLFCILFIIDSIAETLFYKGLANEFSNIYKEEDEEFQNILSALEKPMVTNAELTDEERNFDSSNKS